MSKFEVDANTNIMANDSVEKDVEHIQLAIEALFRYLKLV
jgi:hypothetical protein